MKTLRRFLVIPAVAALLSVNGLAAPSLPVVRPMVSPALSFAGPTNDPHAGSGQWFRNLATSNLENRTHEFYDNTLNTGGGAMGHLAISGVVVNVTIVTDPSPGGGDTITAFDVLATVYNDAASAISDSWTNGINSHEETLNTLNHYTNTLENIILTTDFATCDKFPDNARDEPAYTDNAPYIVATNQDYAGWFCWNPLRPDLHQVGDFSVPGWNFGRLLPGQSTTRLLSFVVHDFFTGPVGIPASDPRFRSIMTSSNNQSDIFINRSSSLKISTWVSTPADDNGSVDYPMDGDHFLGNVSVFHNIAGDPGVAIIGASFQVNPLTLIMNSVGSSGVVKQILQSTTNLMTQNWVDVAENQSWPLPYTNCWTNVIIGTEPVNFYRIIQ